MFGRIFSTLIRQKKKNPAWTGKTILTRIKKNIKDCSTNANDLHNVSESKGKKIKHFLKFSFLFVDLKRLASCRMTV